MTEGQAYGLMLMFGLGVLAICFMLTGVVTVLMGINETLQERNRRERED